MSTQQRYGTVRGSRIVIPFGCGRPISSIIEEIEANRNARLPKTTAVLRKNQS